jgi:hypothetical protein
MLIEKVMIQMQFEIISLQVMLYYQLVDTHLTYYIIEEISIKTSYRSKNNCRQEDIQEKHKKSSMQIRQKLKDIKADPVFPAHILTQQSNRSKVYTSHNYTLSLT